MRSTFYQRDLATLSLLLVILLQPGLASSGTLEEAFEQCRAVADDNARLDCYDGISQAKDSPEVASQDTTDTQTIPATVTQSGGGSTELTNAASTNTPAGAQSAEAQFGKEHWTNDANRPQTLESEVSSVQSSAMGQVILVLENGQIWKQQDVRRLSIRKGDTVIIERGSMNSFFIKEKGASRLERFSRLQ